MNNGLLIGLRGFPHVEFNLHYTMKRYNLFEALHYFHQAEVQAITSGYMTELSFYQSRKQLELRVFCDAQETAPMFLCLRHLDMQDDIHALDSGAVCYSFTLFCE